MVAVCEICREPIFEEDEQDVMTFPPDHSLVHNSCFKGFQERPMSEGYEYA